MSTDDTSYASYCRYAAMVGSPVLDRESWDRLRHKLDKSESKILAQRDKWLAADAEQTGKVRG